MNEKTKKPLYSGTLVSLTQNIGETHSIVALRLHRKGRSYPAVLFRDACYSQFEPECVGKKIVWAREVTREELQTEHPKVWLIYKNSREAAEEFAPPLAGAITSAMDSEELLVLHHMNDKSEYLVQAASMEILKKPPDKLEPWEIVVPPITEEEDI